LLGAAAFGAALALPPALRGESVAEAQPLPPPLPRPLPLPGLVTAELLLLHGTNNNTGIDPKVGRIPALSKPPFSSYNSYDLVKREALELAPNRAAVTRLPNKGDLAVTYQGATQKGGATKYIVDLSIHRHGAVVLPLLQVNATPGEMLFAAVPGYRGGVLVIGVRLMPQQ
jgi:hypothetical protein